LLSAATHPEEENQGVYALASEFLDAVDAAPEGEEVLFLSFAARLAAELGFRIDPERCGVCGRNVFPGDSSVRFAHALGAPVCSSCLPPAGPVSVLSASDHRLLGALCSGTVARAAGHPTAALKRILADYLSFHVAGLHTLKSFAVFEKLAGNV
jgi:recombinational DNA repair protein (RecF pathway)